jgi:membrane protein
MAPTVGHDRTVPRAAATPLVDSEGQADGHLSDEARRGPALRRAWCGARDTTRAVVDGFEEHDLLTYASAVSFQILTAMVPFFLFALAIAGLLHQHAIWSRDLAPEIRSNVSSATFTAISTSVNDVLASKQVVWATLGGGLTLWQISGAVRAIMGALNKIYRSERQRGFMRRMLISFALSIAVGVCFVLTALSLRFAPFFFSASHHGTALAVVGFVARWGLAVACLALAVGLLVHVAPATPQPLPWVSLGTLIVVALWVLTTTGFALYLSDVASYDSLFGGLAVFIVLTGYLYLSATVFLLGALLDALVRTEAKGTAAGASHGSQGIR